MKASCQADVPGSQTNGPLVAMHGTDFKAAMYGLLGRRWPI